MDCKAACGNFQATTEGESQMTKYQRNTEGKLIKVTATDADGYVLDSVEIETEGEGYLDLHLTEKPSALADESLKIELYKLPKAGN